jgi:hypothetical protein
MPPVIALLLTLHVAQAADCQAAVRAPMLEAHIDEAEFAWTAGPAEFEAKLAAIDLVLPCVTDTLRPGVISRLHRLHGLAAMNAGRTPTASRYFAAARYADSDAYLPDALAPKGSPAHELFSRVELSAGLFAEVEEPATGKLMFDGEDGVLRPMSWPTLFQVVSPAGAAIVTASVSEDAWLPSYEKRSGSAVAVVEPDKPEGDGLPPARVPGGTVGPKEPSASRPILLGTAAGAGAISVIMYGIAGANSAKFNGELEGYNRDDLQSLRGRTNGMVIGSAAAAAVALGAFTGAQLTVKW